MKSMRIALLAAALAVVPAAAYADTWDHADRGDRGGRGGGDQARPTPPQAQSHGPGTMVMPRAAPDGGRPSMPPPPQAQPQNRGGWQGGWRGPGMQGRGDVHVERPMPVPNADTGQARAQWRQDNRGGTLPNDGRAANDHRWDGRGPWNGGDHRPGNDDGRTGDHRWDNGRGQWNGGDHRSGNDDDRNRDHRWDGNRDHRDNVGDHRWDGRNNPGGPWNGNRNWGGRPGGDHRWDANRWRNDHRYDWRDWRDNHRDLFHRRYYGPRGYHYRSVYAGFFLEPFFYGSSYWLDDPFDYRLPPVEWPLRWVHYYNDALLVDVTTGEVVDVIPNFFF